MRVSITTMLAPGTVAPAESVTVPVTDAKFCARALEGAKQNAAAQSTLRTAPARRTLLRIDMPPSSMLKFCDVPQAETSVPPPDPPCDLLNRPTTTLRIADV